MINMMNKPVGAAALVALMMVSAPAWAHSLIARGAPVLVAKSNLEITPARDWNKLSARPGKKAETWTLDGPRLNDLTFYGAIAAGEPLVRERSKKKDPLPKLPANAMITDIPEYLEGTYRAHLAIAGFTMGKAEPVTFLGGPAVRFNYDYILGDELGRQGVSIAALRDGKLYMISYDAPRLHFFGNNLADFEAVAAAAKLN